MKINGKHANEGQMLAKIAELQAQANAEYLFGLAHETQSRNCEASAVGIREAGFRVINYADELKRIAEGGDA